MRVLEAHLASSHWHTSEVLNLGAIVELEDCR